MRTLLKPTDLAQQLGVSRAWVYDRAKAGTIPSVRIGGPDGPLRFVPEDIDAWIEEARAGWTPAHDGGVMRRRPAGGELPRVRRSGYGKPPDGQQSLI